MRAPRGEVRPSGTERSEGKPASGLEASGGSLPGCSVNSRAPDLLNRHVVRAAFDVFVTPRYPLCDNRFTAHALAAVAAYGGNYDGCRSRSPCRAASVDKERRDALPDRHRSSQGVASRENPSAQDNCVAACFGRDLLLAGQPSAERSRSGDCAAVGGSAGDPARSRSVDARGPSVGGPTSGAVRLVVGPTRLGVVLASRAGAWHLGIRLGRGRRSGVCGLARHAAISGRVLGRRRGNAGRHGQ